MRLRAPGVLAFGTCLTASGGLCIQAMALGTAAALFIRRKSIFLVFGISEFLKGCLASEARQAVGKLLWVSTGGRCGYVGKPGVLQACPHTHADPLLIHQAVYHSKAVWAWNPLQKEGRSKRLGTRASAQTNSLISGLIFPDLGTHDFK